MRESAESPLDREHQVLEILHLLFEVPLTNKTKWADKSLSGIQISE